MITPSKFLQVSETVLPKLPIIIDAFDDSERIESLYETVHRNFSSIDEFILAVDVLYVLKCLDFDDESGVLRKC